MPDATEIHLIFRVLNNFNHFRYAINTLDEGIGCRFAELLGKPIKGFGGQILVSEKDNQVLLECFLDV